VPERGEGVGGKKERRRWRGRGKESRINRENTASIWAIRNRERKYEHLIHNHVSSEELSYIKKRK